MSQLPALPRELIDHIITSLISLYDHDPAYQWTHLRHITRHHKKDLEQHYLKFWVPKLSFEIHHYHSSCPTVEFEGPTGHFANQKVSEGNEDADIVTFRETCGLHLSDVPRCWPEEAGGSNDRHPWEQYDEDVLVRFGEGTLNKGFAKGGMRNDVTIPRLSINLETWPWEFSCDWKALFTRLFTEELVTRAFRDKLLGVFNPTLEKERKSPDLQKAAIHDYLRNHFYRQRRAVLKAYRRYKYPLRYEEGHCGRYPREHHEGRCYKAYTPKQPFDFTPYVYRGGEKLDLDMYDNFYVLAHEESMVFQVPGWETWDVRDIARLHVIEEIAGSWCELPSWRWEHPEDVLGSGFWGEDYKDELDEMERKRVASDEVLEERLRAEELDPNTFWL